MTRARRRRSRAVYRVYDEQQYLAGADVLDAFSGEDPRLAAEPKHGRGLRRIAGAAALTGTVGAVGGVVGLVGPRTHASAPDRREIAGRIAPSARASARSGHANLAAQAVHGQAYRRSPAWRIQRPRDASPGASLGLAPRTRVSVRALAVSASRLPHAHRSEGEKIADRSANTGASSSMQASNVASGTPALATSASQRVSPGEARPAAQSEFGFER